MPPLVRSRRVPVLAAEVVRALVADRAPDVRRDAVARADRAVNVYLDAAAVNEPVVPEATSMAITLLLLLLIKLAKEAFAAI